MTTASTLSAFPDRVRIASPDGLATPEFLRFLSALYQRAAGSDNGADVFQASQFFEESLSGDYGVSQQSEAPLEQIEQQRIPEAWPVGSVFVSVVATDPAVLLGYGTWTVLGAGRTLFAYQAGDPDFGTLEGTGGAKTKAISAHSGAAVADHASHTHTFTQSSNAASPGLLQQDLATGYAASGTTGGPNATLTHTVTQPSNHTDLNVLAPFTTVMFWKRTA